MQRCVHSWGRHPHVGGPAVESGSVPSRVQPPLVMSAVLATSPDSFVLAVDHGECPVGCGRPSLSSGPLWLPLQAGPQRSLVPRSAMCLQTCGSSALLGKNLSLDHDP